MRGETPGRSSAHDVAARTLDLDGLQRMIEALVARGYTVLGPRVRDGAVALAPVTRLDELPRGWGDEQEAGRYRLRRRDDEALFGYANGAASAKPVFFPTEALLWRGRRDDGSFDVREDPDGATEPAPPYALLGVRSCDLHAIGVQDTVLGGRAYVDGHYLARREAAFLVAVTCADPGGTCFCASMGTGPRPTAGQGATFDLALTELLDEGGHRFLVEVGTARGEELLDTLTAPPAAQQDVDAADRVAEVAVGRMGRHLDTAGLKELLYASADSPVWDDVATRCLACTSCTAVCPTCFCTTVRDVTDLSGTDAARERVWDSCFTAEFSYIHGGTVRASTRARYRQWMTHKLASWVDQFGTSGCVGCGRCVTWCPAAIDITEEAARLRAAASATSRPAD